MNDARLNRQKFVVLGVWGALLILVSARLFFYKPLTLPKNTYLAVEATVSEIRQGESGQVIKIADVTVFADSYPQFRPGDRLIVEGKVDAEGRIFNAHVNLLGHRDSFSGYVWELRQKIAGRIEALLPAREATLVVGTVLGVDKIGREFRDELIKTGTIHVVVVSGANLTLVAGSFMAFSKYLGRRLALVMAIAAAVMYAALTGFEPPVVRALIMVVVSAVALFFGRASTAVLSLFAAAMAIVFVWPGSLSSVSFQLTFAATLGIVTVGEKLKRKLRIPVLGENTAVCVGAFVFTAPVILYHFGSVSLVSPLVNILVSEAVLPVMVLGFLLAFAVLVFMPLASALSTIVFVPARYFSAVVGFFAQFNVGYVWGLGGNLLLIITLAVFVCGLFFIWARPGRRRE